MNSTFLAFPAQRNLVALAAFAFCMAAQAQSSNTNVEGTVTLGVGAIDASQSDRAVAGQYTDLGSKSVVGQLGIDYSLRDQSAGKWVDFTGSDLLGGDREMHLVWKNPGAWKLIADYGELVHVNPNTLNTSLIDAGSASPRVVSPAVLPGGGADTELKTQRTSFGLGLTKIVSPRLQIQIDLKGENKEGTKANSLAYTCSALQGVMCNSMFPEPIDAKHSQIEARVSYALEKLRLNLGYYGSFYGNTNAALTPSGFATSSSLNLLAQALPPDNQAHQLDLSGSYDISPTTRGTFKLAWATASQNADFSDGGFVGPVLATNNLGGATLVLSSAGAKVNTTLAKVGFTSRPMPKLSLSGDLRYEDKDDQTPLFNYNVIGLGTNPNGSTYNLYGTNANLPNTKVQGKLQANWQFNSDYRGTLGADYESIDRGTYTASSAVAGVSALRQQTEETTVRAELRRRLGDALNGAITLSSSNRDGSNWLQPASGVGSTGVAEVANPVLAFAANPAAVFMPNLADRQRDKVKVFVDWQPSKELSLQFSAEENHDKYSSPNLNGLHSTHMNHLGVDWSYALSSNWAINGYVSQTTQSLYQTIYQATGTDVENTNVGASLGVTGKINPKLRVGGSLIYVDDSSVYAQTPQGSAPPSVAALLQGGGVPDVTYRQIALKLFANYELEKQATLRFDLMHQRVSVNDWTWGVGSVPFTYSDGGTMMQSQNQNVSYLGVTYIYQLR
jgi:MtrB/PioB family decaheme-associated outer membrane protein